MKQEKPTDPEWEKLESELRLFLRWTVSGFIDAVFLLIWVFIQWGTGKLLANLELSGIDQWQLWAFQVLFAISTLASVVIYIFTDISVMVIQARNRINKELKG